MQKQKEKNVSYSRGIDYSYYKDCLKLYYIINDIEKVFEFDDTMKISLKELEKEINKRII